MEPNKFAKSELIFVCDNCDKPIKRGIKHCPNCGAELSWDDDEEKLNIKYCSNCGKKVKAGEKFCTECGTALDGTAPKEDTKKSKVHKEFKVPYMVKLGLIFGGIYLLKGLFLDNHQYDKPSQFFAGILGNVAFGLILGSVIGLIIDYIKKARKK